MNRLIIFFTLNLFSCKIFCQVFISGAIKNAPKESEVSITYFNNYIEMREIEVGKIKLDDQGKFMFSFNLNKPKMAKLTIDSQFTNMFLVPNDSLFMTVDFSKFDSSIQYKGKGAADNNYVVADHLANFEMKANRYSAFNDADKYKLYEDSLERVNHEFFKLHDTQEFTPEFRNYITSDMKYRYINPRWMYKFGYDKVNKKMIDKPIPENYFDFLKALNLDDQNAWENGSYSIALMRYLTEMNDSKTFKSIPDTLSKLQKAEWRITKDYNYRKSIFRNSVLDYQLTWYLKLNLILVIEDTKFAEELIKDYKAVCKNAEYISFIQEMFTKANKLTKGNIAPEFTLTNLEGKQVSLSTFKGKTVYIDFWATWCVPCIIAMPDSRKLMEKFKDRKDIVFLYINVKDEFEKWKSYLSKEPIRGENLFSNKKQSDELYSSYNFSGIPHYVLIDRNGKLINSNAERPINAERSILEASN